MAPVSYACVVLCAVLFHSICHPTHSNDYIIAIQLFPFVHRLPLGCCFIFSTFPVLCPSVVRLPALGRIENDWTPRETGYQTLMQCADLICAIVLCVPAVLGAKWRLVISVTCLETPNRIIRLEQLLLLAIPRGQSLIFTVNIYCN